MLKYHSPCKMTEGKVAFCYVLFVALAGIMVWMGLELFMKRTLSALLNVTKFVLLKNFVENFTILNSTAVQDFENKYENNI